MNSSKKSPQPVRGTSDLLPDAMRRHNSVIEAARAGAARYGFAEMATPIFEFDEVFRRTIGETSDIVTKEMYSFEDRGGDTLTLRPENTAGVVRAFISNGLAQDLPLKFFYQGPMFRYERPQKGRQRQFHQVGVELLGVAGPQADIEVIALAADFLRDLGVDQKAICEINSLGDGESRSAYRGKLVAYLEGRKGDLSADSRKRLDRNPLRILDSKRPRRPRGSRTGAAFGRQPQRRLQKFFRPGHGRAEDRRHRLSPKSPSGAGTGLLLSHRVSNSPPTALAPRGR